MPYLPAFSTKKNLRPVKWETIPHDEAAAAELEHELQIHPLLCRLLVQRGVRTYEEARRFFRPSWAHLHDPFRMQDMEAAVARLTRAIADEERILLYGDYDVDGTTSVALMHTFLSHFTDRLDYYIPDRYREGYGISLQGMDYAAEQGATLVIAMDCGITAVEQVAYAHSKSIDCIICDHHLSGDTLPDAVAVLDPQRKDCDYPYKYLSGCGVAFKLAQGYVQRHGLSFEEYLLPLTDLLAVSIACDIVPITDENRTLARFGLARLAEAPCLGLRVLTEMANRKPPFAISDVVFGVGPVINAAGRLGDAREAVALLLECDTITAHRRTESLITRNLKRRELDRSVVTEARGLLDALPDLDDRHSLVLMQPHWHKGIIGISASRVVERYHRPTIMLTESNGQLVGSARSVRGFDLHRALGHCSDLLVNYGGHAFAAGLTLRPERLGDFRMRFEAYAAEHLQEADKEASLSIAAELDLDDLTPRFWKILKQMEPHGPRNRRPVFVARRVHTLDKGTQLLKNNHLMLRVRQGKLSFKGIAFGQGEHYELVTSGPFDMVFVVEEDHWQGRTSLRLSVRDIRACG